MSDNQTQTPQEQPRGPRRWLRYAAAGLFAAMIGGGALYAAAGDGSCGDRAGKFMDSRVEKVLSKLDATPDQQADVKAIVESLRTDLAALRGDERLGPRTVIAELAKPNVDRAALEALRMEHIGRAEQASQRIVQAMADAAESLTPEQRARLPEILPAFGKHKHR